MMRTTIWVGVVRTQQLGKIITVKSYPTFLMDATPFHTALSLTYQKMPKRLIKEIHVFVGYSYTKIRPYSVLPYENA